MSNESFRAGQESMTDPYGTRNDSPFELGVESNEIDIESKEIHGDLKDSYISMFRDAYGIIQKNPYFISKFDSLKSGEISKGNNVLISDVSVDFDRSLASTSEGTINTQYLKNGSAQESGFQDYIIRVSVEKKKDGSVSPIFYTLSGVVRSGDNSREKLIVIAQDGTNKNEQRVHFTGGDEVETAASLFINLERAKTIDPK